MKPFVPKPRCKVAIYKRDTYRRTGRGRGGFSMHYNKQQCSRAAVPGTDRCKQHTNDRYRDSHELLNWWAMTEPRSA